MTQKYQFCFDISLDEKLGFYVPTAYINDNLDVIDYVDKKATPSIIKSFGLTTEDLEADIVKILNIIEILKPENLYKKFEKNPKNINVYSFPPQGLFGRIHHQNEIQRSTEEIYRSTQSNRRRRRYETPPRTKLHHAERTQEESP